MIIFNRYKITDINKFKKFLFVSILLISMVLFVFIFTIKVYSKDIAKYNLVHVKEGDTLWSIASSHPYNGDIRDFIHIISIENNINNATIYPNDIIKVPMYAMK